MNTNTKPVSLADAILATIKGQNNFDGEEWPDSALYAAKYSLHTWPMGWESFSIKFFDTREELDKWLADKKEWARCEDNGINIDVFEWDLGISHIENIYTLS